VKKTRIQPQLSIVSVSAISTLLGGGFLVCGYVALLVGLRLYGPVGIAPGMLPGGLMALVLNVRDHWSATIPEPSFYPNQHLLVGVR
jgi:hypothetical protein